MENANSFFSSFVFFASTLLLRAAPFSKTSDVWYSCFASFMIHKGTERLQNLNFIGIPVIFYARSLHWYKLVCLGALIQQYSQRTYFLIYVPLEAEGNAV